MTHVTKHTQTEYKPTLYAVLLHQIPHVNITFHPLEDERFRPDSELYLESLGIIGSVPAAWLILTLIILLIYLLTRCCDTKNNKVSKKMFLLFILSYFPCRKENRGQFVAVSRSLHWFAVQLWEWASTGIMNFTEGWRGFHTQWFKSTREYNRHKNRWFIVKLFILPTDIVLYNYQGTFIQELKCLFPLVLPILIKLNWLNKHLLNFFGLM